MDRNREESGEGAAASAGRSAGEAAASVAQRFGEGLDQGKAALADFQAFVTERTRECARTTDEYVRTNPWQAIGIAAGLGLIVGLLIRRR
jgi:ElaB/YqjD/DUF883 family membrane-anchored ribosome-binding protein